MYTAVSYLIGSECYWILILSMILLHLWKLKFTDAFTNASTVPCIEPIEFSVWGLSKLFPFSLVYFSIPELYVFVLFII